MKTATKFGILVVLATLLVVSLSIAEDDKATTATSKPTNTTNMTNVINVKPLPQPPLVWVSGTINQILVQPGEQFYVFMVTPVTGSAVNLRIADAHTGASMSSVDAGNLVYDLMKEAYLRKLDVQVGYRDFGYDPQSGINNLVIDRVSLTGTGCSMCNQ